MQGPIQTSAGEKELRPHTGRRPVCSLLAASMCGAHKHLLVFWKAGGKALFRKRYYIHTPSLMPPLHDVLPQMGAKRLCLGLVETGTPLELNGEIATISDFTSSPMSGHCDFSALGDLIRKRKEKLLTLSLPPNIGMQKETGYWTHYYTRLHSTCDCLRLSGRQGFIQILVSINIPSGVRTSSFTKLSLRQGRLD